MTGLIRANVPQMAARANAGRWIVDCPRCRSALKMIPPDPLFECWDCGQAAEVIWPPEETVASIERILLMRPDPTTRNWFPGETLPDLMLENAVHGIFDNLDQLELPAGSVFTVDDRSIRLDALPLAGHRLPKALSASERV